MRNVRGSEGILIVFIPLHNPYQYNIAVRLGDWTHSYELAQISNVLNTEALRRVQAFLLNRAYAARPVGSLFGKLCDMVRLFPAYLLQNMGSGFAVRRMVFKQA